MNNYKRKYLKYKMKYLKLRGGSSSSDPNQNLLCPITQQIMIDPVLTSDGQTYERNAIQQWFDLGNRTSPLTGAMLPDLNLRPNVAIQQLIEQHNTQDAVSGEAQGAVSGECFFSSCCDHKDATIKHFLQQRFTKGRRHGSVDVLHDSDIYGHYLRCSICPLTSRQIPQQPVMPCDHTVVKQAVTDVPDHIFEKTGVPLGSVLVTQNSQWVVGYGDPPVLIHYLRCLGCDLNKDGILG